MLEEYLPPHIYRIESQPMYFDEIRKKYVLVTARETVRQRVIAFLLNELEVPPKMLRIGEKLTYYGLNFRHRADIVIEKFDKEEKINRPLMVVECKSAELPLEESAFNEAFDYAEKLGCKYCMLTNINETHFFYLDAENYIELETLPTYREMTFRNEEKIFGTAD